MKRLLVDKNIAKESADFLCSLGYNLIFSTNIEKINNSTSTHPDMQFLKINDNTAVVADCTLDYYKSALPDFNYFTVNNIKSPYPNDTILNFVLLKNNAICTKYQFNNNDFLKEYNCVFVNQGYTKCSICVLNDNAIITSDNGIIKKLKNFGFNAYFLPDNEINLYGYKNGFWGGASGLIAKNKLYFNGNIENLSCYKELIYILEKEKIEPIYHTNTDLYDNGSIILLD